MYLSPALKRALADYARRAKVPQAQVIRDAIASVVVENAPRRPRFIAAGADDEVSGRTSEEFLRKRLRTK